MRHNVWDEESVDDASEDFYGRARERAHRDFLERVAGSPGRVLDVGCGLGYFLARAQSAGWEVRGCDTSAPWVELANRRLGRQAVSLGGPVEALGDDERFDLVTAWDVVEHVHEPADFMRALRRRLAPGGRLFLRTPNITYVLAVYRLRRRLGHAVRLGPTNHVVYFGASTMRRALALAGLQPVDWPVLAPPQIETFGPSNRPGLAVKAKNAYAAVADQFADASRGRVLVGSDLDVVAVALPR